MSAVLQNHILEEIGPQNGFYFHQFLSISCRKNTLIGAEQQYSFNDKTKDIYLKCFIFLPPEHNTNKNYFFTEIKCKPRTIDSFLTNWNASKHIALTYNILIQKPCCFNANLPHIFRRRLQLTVSKQISIY